MLPLLKYNLLSPWVRRTTTLPTTGGIALVVFVFGGSQMLSTGIRQTISSAGSADQGIVLDKDAWTEAASRMDHAAVGLVAAAPGVKRNGAGQAMVTEEAAAHLRLRSRVDPTRISTVTGARCERERLRAAPGSADHRGTRHQARHGRSAGGQGGARSLSGPAHG